MFINLNQFGNSGGGSGYTLPVASQSTLGGVKIGNGIDIDSGGTISVTGGTGGGIEVVSSLPASGTDGQMVYLRESGLSGTTQTLYTWSDTATLSADIDYTNGGGGNDNWCVRFKCKEFPNGTIAVLNGRANNTYYVHIVHENGELHSYQSKSADTYTATTYTNIPKNSYFVITSELSYNCAYVYWTDDKIIILHRNSGVRERINFEAFYKIGWNTEHRINNNAFYSNYSYYDADYELISYNPDYPLYSVNFRLNPTSSANNPFQVYSKNSSTIGPFFAPTTTGTTGQVCIAGNGWAAPTWANPETLTNGVKFWKGTQDEYDAIGEGNYDANTLYIIAD